MNFGLQTPTTVRHSLAERVGKLPISSASKKIASTAWRSPEEGISGVTPWYKQEYRG
jgi:hypothetical protein